MTGEESLAVPSPLGRYASTQKVYDAKMAQTLERAALAIQKRLERLSFTPGIASTVRAAQLRLVLAEIKKVQLVMWTHGVTSTVIKGQKAAAEAAVRATEDLERVMYASLPETVADGLRGSLRATAQAGIDRAYTRVPRELSQRVYKDFAVTSGQVESIIRAGIVSGLSAKELAADVYHLISPTVPGGASYAAQRLARTEINNAFHTQQIAGGQRPGVKAVKWNLSGSHKRPDECNQFAAADNDLGVGCYAAADVPGKPHPQCLCYMTYVTMSSDEFEKALIAGKFDNELDARIKRNLELLGQRPVAKSVPPVKAVKPRSTPKPIESKKTPPVSAAPVDKKIEYAIGKLKNGASPGELIRDLQKVYQMSGSDALKIVNAAKKGDAAARVITTTSSKVPLRERVLIPGKNGDLIKNALEDQARLVPKVAQQLQDVRFGESPVDFNQAGQVGLYRPGVRRIFLDKSIFDQRYEDVYARELRAQFSTPCGHQHNAAQAVFNHEFGHHVHKYIDEAPHDQRVTFWNNVERELGMPARSDTSMNFRVMTQWLQDNKRLVTNKVSQYASTNPFELLAEIWQEYSSKGDNARPHIKAIGRMMQEFAERSVT